MVVRCTNMMGTNENFVDPCTDMTGTMTILVVRCTNITGTNDTLGCSLH